uniref:Uncharacterized protein n=1 Tax=Trichuris muris TaxID=70415 RepID=A0A5S6QT21_TRIMR
MVESHQSLRRAARSETMDDERSVGLTDANWPRYFTTSSTSVSSACLVFTIRAISKTSSQFAFILESFVVMLHKYA